MVVVVQMRFYFLYLGPIWCSCSFVDPKQQYMIDYNIPCEVFMSDNLCWHYVEIVSADEGMRVCACAGG